MRGENNSNESVGFKLKEGEKNKDGKCKLPGTYFVMSLKF